jgi:hypothetical protein
MAVFTNSPRPRNESPLLSMPHCSSRATVLPFLTNSSQAPAAMSSQRITHVDALDLDLRSGLPGKMHVVTVARGELLH